MGACQKWVPPLLLLPPPPASRRVAKKKAVVRMRISSGECKSTGPDPLVAKLGKFPRLAKVAVSRAAAAPSSAARGREAPRPPAAARAPPPRAAPPSPGPHALWRPGPAYVRLDFEAFVTARQRVLHARRAHPDGAPDEWTPDPVLQRGRFCNIDRRDDHVTAELLASAAGLGLHDRIRLAAALRFTGSRRGAAPHIAEVLRAGGPEGIVQVCHVL